jgi:hypothetical protein
VPQYPKPPHLKPAAEAADAKRRINRLEGSRDTIVTLQSQLANRAFLATLSEAAHVTETNTGGWTTGGALAAGSWDNTHANALVTWMNQVHADIAAILAALQGAGLMS